MVLGFRYWVLDCGFVGTGVPNPKTSVNQCDKSEINKSINQ